jgi:hypothetical protein
MGAGMTMSLFESESHSKVINGTWTKLYCTSLAPSSSSICASSSESTSHHVFGPFWYFGVFLWSRHRALCNVASFFALLELRSKSISLVEWMKLYLDQFLFAAKVLTIWDNKRIEGCWSFGASSPCILHQTIGSAWPKSLWSYIASGLLKGPVPLPSSAPT